MDELKIAHKSPDGTRIQSIEEHLINTAEIAGSMAKAFGMQKEAQAAGALHDIGKVSSAFQKRISENGPKCDHSTSGGAVAAQINRPDIAMCVMGHHAGMPDLGSRGDSSAESTYQGRRKKAQEGKIPDYSEWKSLNIEQYLTDLPAPDPKLSSADYYLKTRLLYSALVDADYLDTEKFCNPDIKRSEGAAVSDLADRFERYIAAMGTDDQKEGINGIRSKISIAAKEAAKGAHSIYSLTAPTGSGKTLASLRFALNYAKEHNLSRIIYVIPYINIIEQTADTFKKILGEENVLEHHSDFVYKESPEDEGLGLNYEAQMMRLATENWNMPIIVTTAVQFFESIFSNRSSRSRKLHNIADAVIIYDEVQMLPVENWQPLISIIEAINNNTPSVQLLCTATQPAIEFPNGTNIKEIVPNAKEYEQKLKRVTFKNSGVLEKEEIIDKLKQHNQALCIVNTKKTAKELFEMLSGGEGNFHLSTNMVPVHRRAVLREIRERLKSGKRVRLIATSLVEAGVDLDFEYVMREIAGLDSILQAAGRCNREGIRSAQDSVTEAFEIDKKPHPGIEQQTQAARSALNKYGKEFENGDFTKGIEYYFNTWRSLRGEKYLDNYKIEDKIKRWAHREIGENFKMINSFTYTVYVPYDADAEMLIEKINNREINIDILRSLSQYGVEVYKNHLDKLIDAGKIYNISNNENAPIYIVSEFAQSNVYDKDVGLEVDPQGGSALFI